MSLPRTTLALTLALAASAPLLAGDKKPEAPPPLEAAFVDRALDAALKDAELEPAPSCEDGAFLRRVTLDLTGTIPSPERTVAFLADTREDKRARYIEELLGSPAYVEHWTDLWMEVLTSTLEGARDRYTGNLRPWVQSQVAKNVPYNVFVARLVRAQGYVDQNGAAAFALNFQMDPALALASTTSRIFMGVQIECAQCHDHPFADWKQEQFLEMAAFFTRMEPRNSLKSQSQIAADLARLNPQARKRYMMNPRRAANRRGLFERPSGELIVNERGEPLNRQNRNISKERRQIKPAFVLGDIEDVDIERNRREAYSRLLTSPKNPYFAKMAVNRIWAWMFGRGLVNPIDDLSDGSFVSHPKFLKQLSAAFVASRYDVRQMLRAIANSKAYQRSSRPGSRRAVASSDDNVGEDPLLTLYGRMPVRPIGARPLARALTGALVPTQSPRAPRVAGQLMRVLQNMLDGRSLDLDRYEETLQEALFLQNSPQLDPRVAGGDDFVAWLLRAQPNDRERITRAFLQILTRPPSKRELERYEAYIAAGKDPRAAYEDLIWVLLNSSEFRYQR